MQRRKKDISCTLWGGDNQFAIGVKWFDIKYKFYGFINDLMETIN